MCPNLIVAPDGNVHVRVSPFHATFPCHQLLDRLRIDSAIASCW